MKIRICNSSTPTNEYHPNQYYEMTKNELNDYIDEKLDAYMESIHLGYNDIAKMLENVKINSKEYNELRGKLDNLNAIEIFKNAGINCIDIEGFRIDLNFYFANYIGDYADLF